MGHDATNFLPSNISKKKLIEFIKLLGYRGSGDHYYFYRDEDYKYLYGVSLWISNDDENLLVITRTPFACGYYDLEFQNNTIRQIKTYFGGYFLSDAGKNRYFENEPDNTTPSERGCYAAHNRLLNYFSDLNLMLFNINQDNDQATIMESLGFPSSPTLLSNLSTTYIASVIENYFRELYIALLKYSDKKGKIISSSNFNKDYLFEVSEDKLTLEEAVAFSRSFQNINKINHYFSELNTSIDIKGILSKPYHRRKESLFQTLDRILEHRHSLVHRLNVDISYKKENVIKDIKSIEVALDKVYEHICNIYHWNT